ncbi:MAG TPA: hypothetical protein ENK43_02580 [Planctomycetes bacterium]|nr:hypothetical protein [Planctomycetota bacterium]
MKLQALSLIFLLCLNAHSQDKSPDPRKNEVPLPALSEWRASLIYESDVGIWTVGTLNCFQQYGCPDVFGLDDRGRCTILSSYSGKWTPHQTVEDGAWLGALCRVDLDPSLDGPEIYTGGKKGNLYQIRPTAHGGFDVRLVLHVPDEEIHTLVAGDLLPERPGEEMLLFSRSGLVFDVSAPPKTTEPFEKRLVARLPGRVRQAFLLPRRTAEPPWIVAACRFGAIKLLRLRRDGLEQETILDEDMGFGRIGIAPARNRGNDVLYATRDDGVILRLEGHPGGSWKREVIYAGPQGARGVVGGRFAADPAVETVAVFGYSRKIQLLSRAPGEPWRVETLFVDRDKGHWLSVAELDGRNATQELIASGYGGRIVLLARPPGYGLSDVPTAADAKGNPPCACGTGVSSKPDAP